MIFFTLFGQNSSSRSGLVEDDDGQFYPQISVITVADLAIFVCIYQVISLLTGVLALLSSVSILFENHSNNSENEWKCFVIGPLEKLSVTLRFSSGDDDCQQTWDRSIISSQVTV